MSTASAIFQSDDPRLSDWSTTLCQPRNVCSASRTADVPDVIRVAEQAARDGRWVALMLSYEAAAAFEPACQVYAPEGEFPLAWVAVFERAGPAMQCAEPGGFSVSEWAGCVSKEQYIRAIRRIQEHIAAGDTYQVNYTFPLKARFEGDERAWFRDLCRAQRAAYSAYLDLGRFKVLSLSPELFFERKGRRIHTRPMKGTLDRGRWSAEDDLLAARLRSCPKNRAENLMIVDLLRNDLGRISTPGSVRVRRLFDVERLETVLQMTSTITAECRPGVDLEGIMRALFPCGSITGAPKIRTMEIIHDLEPLPRQVYTGAIGLIKPGGDCIFNVAIRTVLLDSAGGDAVFGVGGGITHDSEAHAEFQECLLKARFLSEQRPEFRLLESLLLERGRYFLLERHLERLQRSAAYFRFSASENGIRGRLAQIRQTHADGNWKVRLLVDRHGGMEIETVELPADDRAVRRVALAANPVDAADPFLYHKTTRRQTYEQAKALRPDCDDLLLWNERGEITESCIANLVAVLEGRKLTPPLECGLLAGTFRQELLAAGQIQERVIKKDDLLAAEGLYLINSVRRWMPIQLID